MKRKILAVAAALLTMSVAACAQPYGPGYGMGPGGGYGPGYGMGPGMMGGGYGPGYGMGQGMMGGGYGYVPNLTREQRTKLSEIQQELAQQHWALMGGMPSQGGPMAQLFGPGAGDEKTARQAYEAMAAAQKQMFEASLQMRKRMDAVLTEEQREQMRK
jgi:Spy/CpxP family protein refolding chaperone